MRRSFSVLCATALTALLVLLVAACGADPTATPTPTTTGGGGGGGQSPTPTPTEEPEFDAEEYFSGKTIRLLVGFSPGGGTDTHSRFFGANLGKFIPGNPTIDVSNVTPNVAAQNQVAASPPDGLTWSYNPSPLIQTAEEDAAQFVASEMMMIGAALRYDAVWLINGDMPYETIEDAVGADGPPIIMADSAANPEDLSQNVLPAMLLADWFDIPFEFRQVASTGTAQALLMLERDDHNSLVRSSNLWFQLPLLREGWVRDGTIRPFASLLLNNGVPPDNAEGPFDAPNALDMLSAEQREVWDGVIAPLHFLSRQLHTTPGVPDEVMAVLRQAWQDAMADDTFRSEFEALIDQEVTVTDDGAVLQEEVARIEAAYKANLDSVGELTQRLFDKYVE